MTEREKVLDSCRRICSGVTDSEETVSRSKEFANWTLRQLSWENLRGERAEVGE